MPRRPERIREIPRVFSERKGPPEASPARSLPLSKMRNRKLQTNLRHSKEVALIFSLAGAHHVQGFGMEGIDLERLVESAEALG